MRSIFEYDSGIKRETSQKKYFTLLKLRKARKSKSKVKVMLLMLVHGELLSQGPAINQQVY